MVKKIPLYLLLLIYIVTIWPVLLALFILGFLEASEIIPDNEGGAFVWLFFGLFGIILNYTYLYILIGMLS